MFNINKTENVSVSEDVVPNSYVQSCTECCFEDRPGKPNVRGKLQQQMMTRVAGIGNNAYEYLDCMHCPVTLNSMNKKARDRDGRYIYWKGTDKIVTEDELLMLEMDDNDLSLYIEVR